MRTPLFIFAAFCGIATAISTLASEPPRPPRRSISWEELRDRCLHPRSYPDNSGPQEIEVACRSREKKLVLATLEQVPYSGQRTTEAWVSTSKFEVSATEAKESRPSQATCLKYKEVEVTFYLGVALVCDDLIKIQNLSDFCSAQIAKVVEQNRITPERKETGVLIDTCETGKPETFR